MKGVVLAPGVVDVAVAAARSGYPFETCGALVGRRDGLTARVALAVPFPNVAEESQRRRRFVIEPIEIVKLDRALRKSGDELLGFYHSHPDHPAEPSMTDMEYFRLWPDTVWIIIPVSKGEPGVGRAWWLTSSEAERAVEITMVSGER